MTPSEFIDLAFGLFSQVSELALTQYFTDDPSGVTYCKISLVEVSKGTSAMALDARWSNNTVLAYAATGPDAWQQKTAQSLLASAPEEVSS